MFTPDKFTEPCVHVFLAVLKLAMNTSSVERVLSMMFRGWQAVAPFRVLGCFARAPQFRFSDICIAHNELGQGIENRNTDLRAKNLSLPFFYSQV